MKSSRVSHEATYANTLREARLLFVPFSISFFPVQLSSQDPELSSSERRPLVVPAISHLILLVRPVRSRFSGLSDVPGLFGQSGLSCSFVCWSEPTSQTPPLPLAFPIVRAGGRIRIELVHPMATNKSPVPTSGPLTAEAFLNNAG